MSVCAAREPYVVDEDVDAAKGGDGAVDHRLYTLRRAEVGGHADHPIVVAGPIRNVAPGVLERARRCGAHRHTRQPSAASARALASPSPRLEPVMTAICREDPDPCTRMIAEPFAACISARAFAEVRRTRTHEMAGTSGSGNIEDRRGMGTGRGSPRRRRDWRDRPSSALFCPDRDEPAGSHRLDQRCFRIRRPAPAGLRDTIRRRSSSRWCSRDTEETWREVFRERGQAYVPPVLVLFEGATQSACGVGQLRGRAVLLPQPIARCISTCRSSAISTSASALPVISRRRMSWRTRSATTCRTCWVRRKPCRGSRARGASARRTRCRCVSNCRRTATPASGGAMPRSDNCSSPEMPKKG